LEAAVKIDSFWIQSDFGTGTSHVRLLAQNDRLKRIA
jgi:hypothetical protein